MAAAQTRLIIKTVLLTLAATALLTALTGTAVLFSGIYNIASTSQHLQPVHTLLETGMHYSVRFHARKGFGTATERQANGGARRPALSRALRKLSWRTGCGAGRYRHEHATSARPAGRCRKQMASP
jgi:hypothetical protein